MCLAFETAIDAQRRRACEPASAIPGLASFCLDLGVVSHSFIESGVRDSHPMTDVR